MIDDEGIKITGRSSKKHYFWSSITMIDCDDEYVYIFFGHMTVLYLPFEVFKTEEEQKEVIDYISKNVGTIDVVAS